MQAVDRWLKNARIAVIGLGYVGLPLALAFARRFSVTGFDIKAERIASLRDGHDDTRETELEELLTTRIRFTTDPAELADCTVFIVTVPTPVDAQNHPDLAALLSASRLVGGALKPGDLVIYESTVYPGCTEEDCVPVLEAASGLRCNAEFDCGYSPERINPGDATHRLEMIRKITSGSNVQAAERVDALYRSVITAGTYRAQSIRVAEAAKVIENTQRDLNIALINELAMIFAKMGLDTEEVLKAAETKWNFIPFRPGLVGGHCIGVDPYYLMHKAELLGCAPQVILAGRQINAGMGRYVADRLIEAIDRKRSISECKRVLVLGFAFKENCPDTRNTRVVDVVRRLEEKGIAVDIHDPMVDPAQALREYDLVLSGDPVPGGYDGIVLAVAHDCFRELTADTIRHWGREGAVIFDLKHVLAPQDSDLRL